MNRVIIMGNLGQDPEVRYMPSGGAATTISVATNRSWTDKNNNEKHEEVSWHRCVAFGKTAEIIAEHFSKGRRILIEGRLKYGNYEKDGQKHYTTDIVIERFEFVESKQGSSRPIPEDDTGQQAPPPETSEPVAGAPTTDGSQASGEALPDEFDDDIPF